MTIVSSNFPNIKITLKPTADGGVVCEMEPLNKQPIEEPFPVRKRSDRKPNWMGMRFD